VLEPRYYSAVDEIRTPQVSPVQVTKTGASVHRSTNARGTTVDDPRESTKPTFPVMDAPNPLGRLPGSVWNIPTSPLIIPDAVREHYRLADHFAAYPPELVRRIILGWSPLKVCQQCGEGRRPVCEAAYDDVAPIAASDKAHDEAQGNTFATRALGRASRQTSIVGEACVCSTPTAETRPGCVLDPMAGTGTTVGVAHKLGRNAIGVDLSMDYARLAKWRCADSGHFDGAEDRTWAEAQGALL
jgi:hypothetical protein